jgi:hypothetical protein
MEIIKTMGYVDINETHHELPASANEQLKEKLLRLAPESGKFPTRIAGVRVTRLDVVNIPENSLCEPSIEVVVQGSRHARIGTEEYHHGENHCLVTGVYMLWVSHMAAASSEKPFLTVSLNIDRSLATQLSAEILPSSADYGATCVGVSVTEVDPDVLDAFLRLIDILDRPEQIPFLAPLIIREIHYRILIGPQGGCLRMISTLGSHSNLIAQAIAWLRENFTRAVHIDALAQSVNMATSTFHRRFKEVTSLSPLQFQKRLRLYEAQR